MRQRGWAYPDGTAEDAEYTSGGLQTVTVGGRVLLAGMYCDADGHNRVDLRDAVIGEVIDAYGHYKEWWNDPSGHFTSFRRDGEPYIAYVRPKWGYRVERVTAQGYAPSGHDPSENEVVSALAPAEVGGRPAIVAGGPDGAVVRDWADADRVLRSWSVPAGWAHPGLVPAGGRVYAWLGWDVPRDTPSGDRWRVAAEHGSQLWDVIADAPAGTVGTSLRVWDIGTGRLLGEAGLPDQPIATTIGAGPAGPTGPIEPSGPAAWAITRTGHIGRLTIPLANIHPSARRGRHREARPPLRN